MVKAILSPVLQSVKELSAVRTCQKRAQKVHFDGAGRNLTQLRHVLQPGF